MSREGTAGGITLGGLVAGLLSWQANHSILWVILHVICGWFYVVYWLVTQP